MLVLIWNLYFEKLPQKAQREEFANSQKFRLSSQVSDNETFSDVVLLHAKRKTNEIDRKNNLVKLHYVKNDLER